MFNFFTVSYCEEHMFIPLFLRILLDIFPNFPVQEPLFSTSKYWISVFLNINTNHLKSYICEILNENIISNYFSDRVINICRCPWASSYFSPFHDFGHLSLSLVLM